MPKTSCDVCASVGYLCPHCSTSDAAGRAAATPDPPDEAAIRSDERERLSAMNALLSEQLEEARKWHLDAVKEKRAAQADAERLFTALDGYIMARITGTDLRDYDDLAERAARAHRSLAAADREKPDEDQT